LNFLPACSDFFHQLVDIGGVGGTIVFVQTGRFGNFGAFEDVCNGFEVTFLRDDSGLDSRT